MTDTPNALPIAARLLARGIPVIVIRQHDGGEKYPDWNDVTSPADCDLSSYRPGIDALAMICGHGVDVVDVDRKPGAEGSVDFLPPFRSFGKTRTGSGGEHYIVRSTGIGKLSPLRTALGPVGDYCGGTAQGGSRMLAFLPGSKRYKHPVAYVEEVEWDLDLLFEYDADEDLIGALLGAGGSFQGGPGHEAASFEDVKTFINEHATPGMQCNYGRRVLEGLIGDLASADAGDIANGRHRWSVYASTRAVEMCKAGCWSKEQVGALFHAYQQSFSESERRIGRGSDREWISSMAWGLANADGKSECGIHGADRQAARAANPADPFDTGLPSPTLSQAPASPPRAESDSQTESFFEPAEVRPRIDVTNVAITTDWLAREIGTGPLAGMFRRGNQIVSTPRVGDEGYVPLSVNGVDIDGPAQMTTVTQNTLAAKVHFAYLCFKQQRSGDVRASFPIRAAQEVVNGVESLANLRPLAGVTHTPMLRRDGTVLDEPGYDEASGMLYLPDPDYEALPVPEAPTRADVSRAVALLEEMLSDFPFATDSDKANYIGFLMTPLLRAVAPPPYRLCVISAPQPGSGKSLLAEIGRKLHGGILRSELPSTSEELSKQITSLLAQTTAPVVQWDNVTGIIRSSVLAGLLTTDTWSDRILGQTSMIEAKNDRVWVMTGNNIALGGDLMRRAIWINIDAKTPHPEQRTQFAIPALIPWVSERRGELLQALLIIARAWFAAGQPAGRSEHGRDSYARWSDVLDGMLTHAGYAGQFLSEVTAPVAAGADDEAWGDFLLAIENVFGPTPWTVKELLEQVDTTNHYETWNGQRTKPIRLSDLPDPLAEKISRVGVVGASRTVATWLTNRNGRWVGRLSVRRDGRDRTKTVLWALESAGSAGSESGPNGSHWQNAGSAGSESGRKDVKSAGSAGSAGSVSQPPVEETLPLLINAHAHGDGPESLPSTPALPAPARIDPFA